MRTYKVTIEEIISEEFEVDAESIEEASEIAEELYFKGEFVVSNPTVEEVNIIDEKGTINKIVGWKRRYEDVSII